MGGGDGDGGREGALTPRGKAANGTAAPGAAPHWNAPPFERLKPIPLNRPNERARHDQQSRKRSPPAHAPYGGLSAGNDQPSARGYRQGRRTAAQGDVRD